MAKRSFHAPNYTPTAQSDATALTSATYQALEGGSGTQFLNIIEVYISGLGGASSPTIMQLARFGTTATTITTLTVPNSDGPLHPSTAVLTNSVIAFAAASVGPSRSSAISDTKLELGLNAFGGIVRWVAAPGEEWGQLGNTAPLGGSVLSAFTGGTVGAVSSHLVYEPF